jgi:hypothetical protein
MQRASAARLRRVARARFAPHEADPDDPADSLT